MMEPMKTTSILSLFETDKEQRRLFIEQTVDSVVNGNVDVKKVHLQIKAMEEIIKGIQDSSSYKDTLLDEALKHGKSFSYQNADWQIKEVGVSYDYTLCNDEELNALMDQNDQLTAQIKERQAFLKTLPVEGIIMVNKETGEVVKLRPPVKKSTTSVTVKLK